MGVAMSNPDIDIIIKRILRDIAVELNDEFDKNFEREAFFSEAWQRRKSPTRPGGHILVDSGTLRRSVLSRSDSNSITFYSTLPYAAIHNEGGEIVVTARMKRFFRAKAYEAAGSFGRKNRKSSDETPRRSISDRQFWGWMHSVSLTPEAEFWCAMAMKPEGSVIKIPKRQFIGASPEVEKAVREIIEKNLTEYFEHFKIETK